MLYRILCMALITVFLSPLPALATGAVKLPGLQHYATVFRDTDGIPHIVARNLHDLCFLQGYVHAGDRLFQMDLQRRQASGTLAEVLGMPALASDVELRNIGLRRAAKRSWKAASPAVRKAVKAYTKGVNQYIKRHPPPQEYALLELSKVDKWTPLDTIVTAKLLAFGLSFDLQDIENTKALLAYQSVLGELGGYALFSQDLFRSAPFDSASTVPDAQVGLWAQDKLRGPKPGYSASRFNHRTLAMIQDFEKRVGDIPFFQRALHPKRHCRGSNEWAVSGRFTQNGRSLIANDPHLALDTPSTFYQNHLKAIWAGYDVIGSSFPGVPFVVLGQTRHISWGATVNPMDVTDVFQEEVKPDPTSPSGLSIVYMDNLEPIIPIPQVFRINQIGDGMADNLAVVPPGGGIPPAVLIVPRRNNGPIIDLQIDPTTKSGTALSIQYTGFGATRELETFLIWNQARDLDDFIEGLQYFDFGSQNFIYTDVHGNIAYFTSGEMPIREDLQDLKPFDPLPPYFIRDGTGGNEWLPVLNPQPQQALEFEILPFDEMPQTVNPPAGYIINANNDPIGNTLDNNPLNEMRPGGGIFYLNPGYDIGTRAGRITQLLEARLPAGNVTLKDMQEIQADVVMLDAQVFTPHILRAFDNAVAEGAISTLAAPASDPRIAEAVGRLADWDYSTPTGIPEGYDASDENGRRFAPSEEEIAASVAATIYSVWRSQFIKNTIDATLASLGLEDFKPDSGRTMTALRNLLDNFDTNNGFGVSGLNFFHIGCGSDTLAPTVCRDTVILRSLTGALELLASDAFAAAFGNSRSQEDYRWGMLHRIVFDHPLEGLFSIPPAGGAFPSPLEEMGLLGIPTDGGFGVVDASSHSPRAEDDQSFGFGAGPARRYVGQPGRRWWKPFRAETILPGGSSGVLFNQFYFNLLERWLTNDTYPVRQSFIHIFKNLEEVEVFRPKWRYR